MTLNIKVQSYFYNGDLIRTAGPPFEEVTKLMADQRAALIVLTAPAAGTESAPSKLCK